MKNLLNKALHGLIVAIPVAAAALIGGPIGAATAMAALKAGGIAFVTYMVKPARLSAPPAAMLVLFAGLALGASSCSRPAFDKCVRDGLISQVESKVQGAVSCHGDESCLISQGVTDVLDVTNVVRQCKAAALDGGPQ